MFNITQAHVILLNESNSHHKLQPLHTDLLHCLFPMHSCIAVQDQDSKYPCKCGNHEHSSGTQNLPSPASIHYIRLDSCMHSITR